MKLRSQAELQAKLSTLLNAAATIALAPNVDHDDIAIRRICDYVGVLSWALSLDTGEARTFEQAVVKTARMLEVIEADIARVVARET